MSDRGKNHHIVCNFVDLDAKNPLDDLKYLLNANRTFQNDPYGGTSRVSIVLHFNPDKEIVIKEEKFNMCPIS